VNFSRGRESGRKGDQRGNGVRKPRGEGLIPRKKICRFCENRIYYIDYKDDRLLHRFMTEEGKIIPRRISGTCAQHQRQLVKAIKRARHMAILPFVMETIR
jgi:small subunit ribosomal protein S18